MSEPTDADLRWLASAVRLARPRLGTTAASPCGAMLVVDAAGRLVGRGYTGEGGRPAPQLMALADARGVTSGTSVYTTIEPESVRGVLASEADRLADAGPARVVIGMLQPDRAQRGRGVEVLRARGIDVVVVNDPACRELNRGFVSRIVRHRPFVTAALVLSRDGMIGMRDGSAAVGFNSQLARWLAFERAFADALLTSPRSLAAAVPDLGVTIAGLDRRPLRRIVVEGATPFAPPADWPAPGTIIVRAGDRAARVSDVDYVEVSGRHGRPDLREVMRVLATRGIGVVQVRAGARLTEALIGAERVDRLQIIDLDVELGRAGIPATPLGDIEGRLRAAGFVVQAETMLGNCRLRSFEPSL